MYNWGNVYIWEGFELLFCMWVDFWLLMVFCLCTHASISLVSPLFLLLFLYNPSF